MTLKMTSRQTIQEKRKNKAQSDKGHYSKEDSLHILVFGQTWNLQQ